jgi:hypothetical protein
MDLTALRDDAASGQSRCKKKPSSSARRGGKRRRGRSMGRFPWIPYAEAYLNTVKPYYGDKTWLTMRRGLDFLHYAFQELRFAGAVTSTSPKKMSQKDIEARSEAPRNHQCHLHAIGFEPGSSPLICF